MTSNKSKGFTHSAAVWVFLFASTLTGSLNYYQLLDHHVPHYYSVYFTGLISLHRIIAFLVACSFTETFESIAISGVTSALRDYDSFPSFITYT